MREDIADCESVDTAAIGESQTATTGNPCSFPRKCGTWLWQLCYLRGSDAGRKLIKVTDIS